MLVNMEPTMRLKLVKYADNNCITLKKQESKMKIDSVVPTTS